MTLIPFAVKAFIAINPAFVAGTLIITLSLAKEANNLIPSSIVPCESSHKLGSTSNEIKPSSSFSSCKDPSSSAALLISLIASSS